MLSVHRIFAEYFDSELKDVAFAVSQKLEEGHVCLDLNSFKAENPVDVEALRRHPMVTDRPFEELQPFVLKHNKLYLHRYFLYEHRIVSALVHWLSKQDLAETRKKYLLENKEAVLQLLEISPAGDIPEVDWQVVAAMNAFLQRFSIITGGPGTGKTTTVAKFLALLFECCSHAKVAIAAPTGKAAARLNESLASRRTSFPEKLQPFFENLTAQTLHRLLGVKYGTPYFKHHENNPLPYDVVVVDESSMIDVALMAKLFDAIGNRTQLILLGDKNQLASVEAGSVFGDLCKTKQQINSMTKQARHFFNDILPAHASIPSDFELKDTGIQPPLADFIIELQKSYRFSNTKGIGEFSHVLINEKVDKKNLFERFSSCVNTQECVQTATYDTPELQSFLTDYEAYARENDVEQALYKLNTVKILCAVKEGAYGVYAYNRLVEHYLRGKHLLGEADIFYHNQPIMITANDYTKQLFNGDIGLVRADANGVLRAYFLSQDGRLVNFRPEFLGAWETVFAMTIHKSQGSEFDNVVVVLPNDSQQNILSRELLYTAVTRARKKVLLLTDSKVLQKTAYRQIERISGIEEQLADKWPQP